MCMTEDLLEGERRLGRLVFVTFTYTFTDMFDVTSCQHPADLEQDARTSETEIRNSQNKNQNTHPSLTEDSLQYSMMLIKQ